MGIPLRLYFLVFIFLVASCANKKTNKGISVFSLEQAKNSENRYVEINSQSEEYDSNYGPTALPNTVNSSEHRKIPVVALFLNSAGYHALGYISLLRQLEKENIKVTMISGQGFSALVAALYAKYGDSNRLEWKLFELMEIIKNKKMFSSSWLNSINKFAQKEFKKTKVEQLKKYLFIPLQKKGALVHIRKAKVVDLIKRNFSLSQSQISSSLIFKYSLFDQYFKKLGADLVFTADLMPRKVLMKNMDGHLWGIYTKRSYQIHQRRDNILELKELAMPIDQYPNMASMLKELKKSSIEISLIIKDKFELWVEKQKLKN